MTKILKIIKFNIVLLATFYFSLVSPFPFSKNNEQICGSERIRTLLNQVCGHIGYNRGQQNGKRSHIFKNDIVRLTRSTAEINEICCKRPCNFSEVRMRFCSGHGNKIETSIVPPLHGKMEGFNGKENDGTNNLKVFIPWNDGFSNQILSLFKLRTPELKERNRSIIGNKNIEDVNFLGKSRKGLDKLKKISLDEAKINLFSEDEKYVHARGTGRPSQMVRLNSRFENEYTTSAPLIQFFK